MAIIKCKMCGGDIELSADKTYGTCDSCGSTMTFPKVSDEQRANLFNRANHFRRQNEFDKAISAYERILDEDNTDAEAHWGVVLSRYGIEYVEDPATRERIPTCHRVQLASILTDADYLAALEYAPDGGSRALYEQEATRIAEIQKDILAISNQEKPYDVFICYKETTDGGSRTKDSALAQDIYYQLTQDGYKVFFSRITLEDKLGQQYEPYIFAALNSARVMVVVGTKPEHFSAVWVKNEWSRYLALMKQDRSRLLIPCYRDMDAYDLPDELSALQSQDMGKIGFMQDLIRGIKKVLEGGSEQKPIPEQAHAPGVTSLLKRAHLFLEDGDFAAADEYAEKVLDIDPECAEAYLVKTLVTHQFHSEEELAASTQSVSQDPNYIKALRFAKEQAKAIYVSYEETIQRNIHAEQLEMEYQRALGLYAKALQTGSFQGAINVFAKLGNYKDSPSCLEDLKEKQQAHEVRVQQEEARRKLEAEEQAARQAQLALERKRREEQQRIEDEKRRRKNRKLVAILSVMMAIVLAVGLTIKFYVLPKLAFDEASAMLEEKQYDEAITAFAALDGWGDSENLRKAAYYGKAMQHLDKAELQAASAYFELAENHGDAKDYLQKIQTYQEAASLVKSGMITEARVGFALLPGFLDADELYLQCCATEYETAVKQAETGYLAQAYEGFVSLGDYSDSAERVLKIEQDYQAAGKLLEDQKYDEAAAAYAALGNYAESKAKYYETLYQKAEALLAEGKYDDAEKQFKVLGNVDRALEVDDAKHAFECEQAETLLEEGKYDEAITRFEELNELERAQAARDAKHAVECAEAETLLTDGKYDEAIARFTELNEPERAQTARDAKHAVECAEAEALLTVGKYDEAITRFIELDEPERAQAARDAKHAVECAEAETLLTDGKYDEAIARFTELNETERANAARYAKAEALLQSGDRIGAETEWELLGSYSDATGRLNDLRMQLASEALNENDYGTALAYYLKLPQLESLKAKEYDLAQSAYDAGDYGQAVAAYEALGQYELSLSRLPVARYAYANQLFEEERYQKAAEQFALLGDFADSAQRVKESTYLHGKQLMASGLYDEAKAVFESIYDYEDAANLIKECTYQKACVLLADGQLAAARELFHGLGEYSDSLNQRKECDYVLAEKLLEQKKYAEAQKLYSSLPSYKDSGTKYRLCVYEQANEKFDAGEYAEAEKLYTSIPTFKDNTVKAKECRLRIGMKLYDTGDYTKAIETLTGLKHGDSEQVIASCYCALGKDALAMGKPEEAVRQYAKAAGSQEAREMLYSIGKDFAVVNQLEKAVETLYLAGTYAPAKELLLILAQALEYSGDTTGALIAHLALGDANAYVSYVSVEQFEQRVMEFMLHEQDDVFRKPIQYAFGQQLYQAEKYDEASTILSPIKSYSNTEQIWQESRYIYANNCTTEQKWRDAYNAFLSLGMYKESDSKASSLLSSHPELAFQQATVGSYIYFGSYEQNNLKSDGNEPIRWLVLAKENEQLLLISEKGLECRPYNTKNVNVTWEKCTLRKWLNDSFVVSAFTDAERAIIATVVVTADKNSEYNTDPGNATQDKVFLLSLEEAEKYFESENKMLCFATEYASAQMKGQDKSDKGWWWWLRSPGEDQKHAVYVSEYSRYFERPSISEMGHRVYRDNVMVRPTLWIKLAP